METNSPLNYQSELIVKYLTNSLSTEEEKHFELWLKESPANGALVESFRDTTEVQKALHTIQSFDPDRAWSGVASKLDPKPVQLLSLKNIARYSAAAVLVFCALGAYLYTNRTVITPTKNTIAYNIPAGKKRAAFESANGEVIRLTDANVALTSSVITAKDGTLYFKNGANKVGNNVLITPKAGEYKMVLSDGTQVWLNASSSLSFSNRYNQEDRKVFLKGEAYFEVAHNKKMPFIVNFNDTEVEVLGTHFNINTYESESKTTLLEGAIKISEKNTHKLLKPGDEATVTSNGIQVAAVETFKTVAWKEGLFLFEEETMTDILEQVARWYDVQIKYNGKPSTKKYSGNIRRQADLNQVLDMLTTVSGNTFTLEARTITVKF